MSSNKSLELFDDQFKFPIVFIAMNGLILRFFTDPTPNMMGVSIADYLIADRNSRAIHYKEAHHG